MIFCGLTACTPVDTVEAESFAAAASEADGVFLWSHSGVLGSDLTQAQAETSVPLQGFKLASSVLIMAPELAWFGGAGMGKWSAVFSWVLTGPCVPLDCTNRFTGPFVVLQF